MPQDYNIVDDKLIGDSEIRSIGFDGRQIRLNLYNINVEKVTEILFHGVRVFQFCSDSMIILDSIETFDGVAAAMEVPSVQAILLNRNFYDDVAKMALASAPNLTVYRFVHITGMESFVICEGVSRSPWIAQP